MGGLCMACTRSLCRSTWMTLASLPLAMVVQLYGHIIFGRLNSITNQLQPYFLVHIHVLNTYLDVVYVVLFSMDYPCVCFTVSFCAIACCSVWYLICHINASHLCWVWDTYWGPCTFVSSPFMHYAALRLGSMGGVVAHNNETHFEFVQFTSYKVDGSWVARFLIQTPEFQWYVIH